MSYEVCVLQDGYSRMEDGRMLANCTCTLLKGPNNMIIDTLTAWDRDKILAGAVRFPIPSNSHLLVYFLSLSLLLPPLSSRANFGLLLVCFLSPDYVGI